MKRLTTGMVVVAGMTVATLGFGACKPASEREGRGGSGRNVETQQGTGTYGGTGGSEPFPGMGADAGIGGSGSFGSDAGMGGSGDFGSDAGIGGSGSDFGTGTGTGTGGSGR